MTIVVRQELEPYLYKAWWAHTAGGSRIVNTMILERKLTKLVGAGDANALLSNLRSGSELASLGPVTGIAKVRRGEMSRADYLAQYGHRGPHEFELSMPHPAEDPTWLKQQLADDATTALDVDGLLARQEAAFAAAKARFIQQYPGKAKWLDKQLKQVAQGAQLRERARSEFTRTFRVVRTYALRAGELTGLGDDIFFLYSADIEALLAGDDRPVRHIPAQSQSARTTRVCRPCHRSFAGAFGRKNGPTIPTAAWITMIPPYQSHRRATWNCAAFPVRPGGSKGPCGFSSARKKATACCPARS
ncbi:MAG: hypothetical protein R3E79_21400 [Caldilineaceae bacterium]